MADVWANSMACHPIEPLITLQGALDEFTVMIPEPHATLHGVRITSAISKIVFRQSHKGFLYQSKALMRLLLILDMTIYWSKICVSSPFLPTPLI